MVLTISLSNYKYFMISDNFRECLLIKWWRVQAIELIAQHIK